MFPVPSHLLRTGGQSSTSRPMEEGSSEVDLRVDTVLELFEPLFQNGTLDSKTVKAVRESVQAAITQNKVS